MARITFKQFIELNEDQDFISSTMGMMPPKKRKNPNTGVIEDNPDYELELKKFSSFPSGTDTIKIDTQKPEGTDFKAEEMPKVVRSGGRAKKRAEDLAGQARSNEHFFKGMGTFWLPPSAYTPETMLRER